MNDRIRQLEQIQMSLPGSQRRVANQYKAANDLILQKTMAQVPATPQAMQAIIGAQAVNQGAQQIQRAQQNQAQSSAVAQLGAQAQQAGFAQGAAQAERGLRNKEFDAKMKLGAISEQAKQELFDSRLNLEQQKATDKFLTTRQLADWAKMKGVRQEDMKDYQQIIQLASEKEKQLLEMAYRKLESELLLAQKQRNSKLENELNQDIAKLKAKIDRKAAKNKRTSSAFSSVLGAGISVMTGMV